MAGQQKFTGSCLCGSVRYAFDGPISGVVCCHCSQCRKQTGHHFAAVVISQDKFQLEGDETLSWYKSSDAVRRGFCSGCGSVLFWESIGADTIDILAGGIDQPLGVGIEANVFVDDKGDYYKICDHAPKYPAGR